MITYTRCIEDLDAGKLPSWSNLPAPPIAKAYWKLSDNATMRDVLLVIRADEATHRQYVQRFPIREIISLSRVNHKLADVGPNAPNPTLIQTGIPPNLAEQREIDTADKN